MNNWTMPIEVTWMLMSLGRVLGTENTDLVHLRRLIYIRPKMTDEDLGRGHQVWSCAPQSSIEFALAAAFRVAWHIGLDEPAFAKYWALRALDIVSAIPGERNLQLLDAVGWDAVQHARARLIPHEPPEPGAQVRAWLRS